MTRRFDICPRYFVLPLLALGVIASLSVPAASSRGPALEGCGPTVSHIADPALRASFARFDRAQSPAAAQVCNFYHQTLGNQVGNQPSR